MDSKAYWANKHLRYSKEDWIDRPSIFSQFAIKFFPETGRILDLGAGQGQDTRLFAEKGFLVVSTDFSIKALEIAKSKTNPKLDILYEIVDLQEDLPYEDNSFDVVYSHMAIHYFDDLTTQKIINEILRVLKTGGILALLLNSKTDPEINCSKLISEDLYETPSGLIKRFFDQDSLSGFIGNKFEAIILDTNGETYKDETKSLIRFVGKKL